MRRALTSAFAAALVSLGAAGNAQAQDMMVRTAPQFDIGIFAGGAYTTSWFSIAVSSAGSAASQSSVVATSSTHELAAESWMCLVMTCSTVRFSSPA